MKKQLTIPKLCILLLVSCVLWGTACKELDDIGNPVNPDPNPSPTNPVDVGEINRLNASMIMNNKVIHSGDMPRPDSGSVPLADFKIKDKTVYLIDDHSYRVILLKPQGGWVLQTFFGQVEGSDEYVEGQFDIESENDSLVFIDLAFDPMGWETPLTFELDIVPIDDSGTPLDEIEVEVVVVEPENASPVSSCGDILDLLFSPDDSDPSGESARYQWLQTNYFNARSPIFRGILDGASGISNGCCTSLGSSYGDCIGKPTHGTAEYEYGITYYEDFLSFRRDGTVWGTVSYHDQNIDVENTDYCSGVAAYLPASAKTNSYVSTTPFTLDADCNIILPPLNGLTIDGWPLLVTPGSGPNVKYKVKDWGYSFKILTEEFYDPEGGNLLYRRYYVRIRSELIWQD